MNVNHNKAVRIEIISEDEHRTAFDAMNRELGLLIAPTGPAECLVGSPAILTETLASSTAPIQALAGGRFNLSDDELDAVADKVAAAIDS
jgi:hypothetical protein